MAKRDDVDGRPLGKSPTASLWRAGDGLDDVLRIAALLSALFHGPDCAVHTPGAPELVEKLLEFWWPFVKGSSWPGREENR